MCMYSTMGGSACGTPPKRDGLRFGKRDGYVARKYGEVIS